jgi:DNA (cytosine-5)-methyltransferase 1
MIAISKYNKQHPLRVFEAFAGYDSQSLAFKYLKDKHPEFDFKVVGYSEIEPSAMGHGGNCIPLFLIVKEI